MSGLDVTDMGTYCRVKLLAAVGVYFSNIHLTVLVVHNLNSTYLWHLIHIPAERCALPMSQYTHSGRIFF